MSKNVRRCEIKALAQIRPVTQPETHTNLKQLESSLPTTKKVVPNRTNPWFGSDSNEIGLSDSMRDPSLGQILQSIFHTLPSNQFFSIVAHEFNSISTYFFTILCIGRTVLHPGQMARRKTFFYDFDRNHTNTNQFCSNFAHKFNANNYTIFMYFQGRASLRARSRGKKIRLRLWLKSDI